MKLYVFWIILDLLATGLFAQKPIEPVFTTADGAIRGYDPVAYFTEGKPVKGRADLKVEWGGGTWHFASEANRDTFQLQPEKFAPAYGGYCAYGWAQGYPAKTEPDAWSIHEGVLYLNYNLSIQSDWRKKITRYIKKADDNWNKAAKKGG
jgi:YHS domain-containing protein